MGLDFLESEALSCLRGCPETERLGRDKSPEAGSYRIFSREEWAALRANTPQILTHSELNALRGLGEPVSFTDIADIYLPLSRLLNLHVEATRGLDRVEGAFLGHPRRAPPSIIGIAGSVAVGKSTLARVLQVLLSRWSDHPRVDLVTTDGFLHPTRVLEKRDLMGRKGFPESYDLHRMLGFLASVKAGKPALQVPVYSHEAYDIVPGSFQLIDRPDILIVEGLNVLQVVAGAPAVTSDFFDFSIYLDATASAIEEWYVERFLLLQRTVFQKPSSYFHHYKDLPPLQAKATARSIWQQINLPNLMENIRPTRERARLVICKEASHAIKEIWLRRV